MILVILSNLHEGQHLRDGVIGPDKVCTVVRILLLAKESVLIKRLVVPTTHQEKVTTREKNGTT